MRDGHGGPRVPRTQLTALGQPQSGVACDAQSRRREEDVSQVRRESDASCVARVVPSAVPSDASRVRPMARIAVGATAVGSASDEWRADAVGPTTTGVVVRLVLLMRTASTARIRDHAGAHESACKKRPQRDPQAGRAQARSGRRILFCHGEIQALTAENSRACWAHGGVDVAESSPARWVRSSGGSGRLGVRVGGSGRRRRRRDRGRRTAAVA